MNIPDFDQKIASDIIARADARPEMLVQILREFVEHFGWVCEDAIRQLADELNLSRAEVHGVVSYYHDFRTSPPGRHVIKVCQAESCQAMGSAKLSSHAEKALGLAMNTSTSDVTLEPVYCLGNCACSPAIMIDGKTHGRVTLQRFEQIIADLKDAP